MRIDAIFLRELRLPLVKPFQTSFGTTTERRILLVELRGEGLSGWGECVAGEHPFFSDETVDTAWLVMQQELAPLLASADPEHGGKCPAIFRQVRGHRMAKAALENAVWDLEAQMKRDSAGRACWAGRARRLTAACRSGSSRRWSSSWRKWRRKWRPATSASS